MGKKSLLLIDDDVVIRDIIKSALEMDYNVLEASDYTDTIKILNRPIDLAIIDYVLPDHNGFEILRLLREVNPSMPAILMTGHSDENVVIKAIRENVADYIKKPVDLAYLRKRLSEIFGDKDACERPESMKVKDSILEGVAAHIEKKYMTDMTLDNLSHMACMNRFAFSRAFKDKFGQTVISFLNAVRIRNAINLMHNPNYRITDIAYHVGYNSVEYFNRVFKAVYKMSPRDYRKRLIGFADSGS